MRGEGIAWVCGGREGVRGEERELCERGVELELEVEVELGVWSIDRSGVIGDLGVCGGSLQHHLTELGYFLNLI